MDIIPQCDSTIRVGSIRYASRRRQTANNAAHVVFGQLGFSTNRNSSEKISHNESPEKWVIRNPQLSNNALLNRELLLSSGLIAFRLLIDAWAWKCGYRTVNWTEEEEHLWELRKQQSGSNRDECVWNNGAVLRGEVGLTDSQIRKLLSADLRSGSDTAAHAMELGLFTRSLKCLMAYHGDLKNQPVTIDAISKIFFWMTGTTMEKILNSNTEDNRIFTIQGAEPSTIFKDSTSGQEYEEEMGTW
jgi:hypothetical protein